MSLQTLRQYRRPIIRPGRGRSKDLRRTRIARRPRQYKDMARARKAAIRRRAHATERNSSEE